MNREATASQRMSQAVTSARARGLTLKNPVNDAFILQSDAFNPLFYADEVSVTPEVPPDGVVDVTIGLTNERVFATPANPDVCRDGLTSGLEADVTVNPSWTTPENVSPCLKLGGFSPTTANFTFDFPAPSSPGTYYVDVTIESTNEGGTVRYEVAVPDPDDPDQPDPRPGDGDGDDDDDDDDDDDGGGGGGGSLLGTEQVIALAAFSLLVVVGLGVSQ